MCFLCGKEVIRLTLCLHQHLNRNRNTRISVLIKRLDGSNLWCHDIEEGDIGKDTFVRTFLKDYKVSVKISFEKFLEFNKNPNTCQRLFKYYTKFSISLPHLQL